MKMEYIKPEMELTLIEGEVLMQSASRPGIGEGEADSSDGLSHGRRGSWGNLWDEGE